ncbi:hypothetical protein WJX73_004328 [Symbiochloris irregularis]|uniref:HIT-type domain-containing protein n=1 Tax=Symbiochloris irregularis TaxID=706552 RepID=A0AAW1P322_9CHLO
MPRATEGGPSDASGRRTGRSRKVSQRMAVVSETDREQVTNARLAALETDGGLQDNFGADSDAEFELQDSDQEAELGDQRNKRKRKANRQASRKTRARAGEVRGHKAFAVLLEEADLDPDDTQPNYLTAAMGPPLDGTPRRWCSVCGFAAPYSCARCRMRYCTRKCYAVHCDTRCLKFTV